MNIENYTSTVDASRSMTKVEELFVEIGATKSKILFKKALASG